MVNSNYKRRWDALKELLQQYFDVFKELEGLSSQQAYNHQIVLKEGSQPINS